MVGLESLEKVGSEQVYCDVGNSVIVRVRYCGKVIDYSDDC